MAMAVGVVGVVVALVISLVALQANGQGGWDTAHATNYGNITDFGACGYGDMGQFGYNNETTALSTVLFNNGATCGSCYELQCNNDDQWCIPGAGIITVTTTNFCPPDPSKPNDDGGWCNPPLKHFDLNENMFRRIAKYEAGIVPIQFRRVPCGPKQSGIKFMVTDNNPYWVLVLVYNVACDGEVMAVSVKGEKTGWIVMTRNWGMNWQTSTNLQGQGLSFQVTTSDGKMVQSDNVVPANWARGQTFEGRSQFVC